MDALITYSQTHQQLINTLQSSTNSNSKLNLPNPSDLLNFNQQQHLITTNKQTENFNNYILNNSYNQIIPLQANDSNNQNKINDFFKILETQNNQQQQVETTAASTSSTSSSSFGFNSPNVFQDQVDNKYETFQDDPNFYNVAAAYNAVSASLVGRLASKQ